jgi:hypothetical protein
VTDLAALPRCPVNSKRGAHHIAAIIPGEDTGDVTLFCEQCGMVRRMPASGALTLDEADAAAIMATAERALAPWDRS